MRAYVVIATRGRPRETLLLMTYLERQTLQPVFTVIVGTEAADIEGIADHQWVASGKGVALISPRAGLTIQRNFGLETLKQKGCFLEPSTPFFCAFFDDDFRMADDWLQLAAERFSKGGIVGLTGHVLADGVKLSGLSEAQAESYLAGTMSPDPHWASGAEEWDCSGSVYGCNMAFIDKVIRQFQFDENLPAYGWQEDRDYTGQAKRLGTVIYFPGCRGVHLGIKSGRVSGVRFGYSQIANPYYIMKKGTMECKIGLKFMGRALLINSFYSLKGHPFTDYRGRLRGNIKAILDMALFRIHPRNIEKFT